MHGPDGTDYPEWISWTEIAPPERTALRHGESRGDPNAFESVLTFEPDGAATRMGMHTVFPTRELRDEAVEKYHAIEGGQQTRATWRPMSPASRGRGRRADGREEAPFRTPVFVVTHARRDPW
jgi:hypothetical protein